MNAWKEITVAVLAEHLKGEAAGDGMRVIRGIAPLDQAGPEALSWLGDPKYLPRLKHTDAAAVLVPRDLDIPDGRTVIRVDDPDMALNQTLRLLGPEPPRVPAGVHPTAVVSLEASVESAAIGPHVTVESGARIGAGTQLHAGVYVGANTEIGSDCVLWPNVVVREETTLGDRVIIHPNSTIGADGFGYLQRGGKHCKIPQIGRVVIEDDVEIGANCCVDRARSGQTRIRRGAKIDNHVQIAHNCDIGEDCIMVGQSAVAGSTTLGDGVMVSGHAGISDHVNVGAGAMIGPDAAVLRDVPAGGVYRGSPAIEFKLYGRQQAAVRRLPKMVVQLRQLKKRIEQLESAATDNSDGN